MSRVCIHQPDFCPYLGFFDRLLNSDHFILLDDVQFIRRGWQHRDRIKGRHDTPWLTLSIKKGDYKQTIKEVLLVTDSAWKANNLNLIRACYEKAPYFDLIYPKIEAIYNTNHKLLIDFNLDFLEMALKLFEIEIPITYASKYCLKTTGSSRLLELTLAVDGTTYLTGLGSKDYLDEEIFTSKNIKVEWQNFNHPVYPQLYGNFVPMLSCLDIIFNCGRNSADVLRNKFRK